MFLYSIHRETPVTHRYVFIISQGIRRESLLKPLKMSPVLATIITWLAKSVASHNDLHRRFYSGLLIRIKCTKESFIGTYWPPLPLANHQNWRISYQIAFIFQTQSLYLSHLFTVWSQTGILTESIEINWSIIHVLVNSNWHK